MSIILLQEYYCKKKKSKENECNIFNYKGILSIFIKYKN